MTGKIICSSAKKNIDVEEIYSALRTKFISRNIKYTEHIDSTNEEAKRNTVESDGTLFIADFQTNGRGRLGRVWDSAAYDGIWMSLLLKPDTRAENIPLITLVAGAAVCRVIDGAKIKWPNDIVIGSRKLCGILTEKTKSLDGSDVVICGIGININTESFSEELSDKATSLYIETGRIFKREKIIADIMNEFEKLYTAFLKTGFGIIREYYCKECVTLNKEVKIIYNNTELFGTAVDVDEKGQLIVRTKTGIMAVNSGEVSVRGMYGYI
jgi:BirA family biotin operon repressor/biotin-[acetyl-CoA-carboxylase] ligase